MTLCPHCGKEIHENKPIQVPEIPWKFDKEKDRWVKIK